ncbi:DUF5134 domain-containing protein [Methylocystis bryophila]|uniref:DUF5134 domain-containing protein n=1 Tax=Methylocystis bryophila TaxID=655015 RepID=A0A1W6MR50_9HYPH|nr:DUF5134 domain-containing protein [Methylocystis bryophila]ARN80073.1 hypothetical protein B1812_02100 [Methylocystis bryophila]BDV39992.1 hypothetical protein DSM21852_32450 [Methylocystis bryophila]
MTALSQDLLSKVPSIVWIAVLCLVLLLEFKRWGSMRGEHRWCHSSHLIMLVGMIYMFFAMAFEREWMFRSAWMTLYAVICLVILFWMMIRLRGQGSIGKMWISTFIQQAAMVYMCYSPMRWIPVVSYALVLYFAFEALTPLISAPMGRSAKGLAPTPLFCWPNPNQLCAFVMAASMGYMFLGMQLKASLKESERLALQTNLEPVEANNAKRAEGSMLSPASALAAATLAASSSAPPPPANDPAPSRVQPQQGAEPAIRKASRAVGMSQARRPLWRSRARAHPVHPHVPRRHRPWR